MISKGAYGKVFSTPDRNGKTMCRKEIKLDNFYKLSSSVKEICTRQINELSLEKRVFPDISGIQLSFTNLTLNIHMERWAFTLYEQLGVFDTTKKRKLLLREILIKLNALHASGCLHRDLKPTNIMLDKNLGRVRLIDGGTLFLHAKRHLLMSNAFTTYAYLHPDCSHVFSETSAIIDYWSILIIWGQLLRLDVILDCVSSNIDPYKFWTQETVKRLESEIQGRKLKHKYQSELSDELEEFWNTFKRLKTWENTFFPFSYSFFNMEVSHTFKSNLWPYAGMNDKLSPLYSSRLSTYKTDTDELKYFILFLLLACHHFFLGIDIVFLSFDYLRAMLRNDIIKNSEWTFGKKCIFAFFLALVMTDTFENPDFCAKDAFHFAASRLLTNETMSASRLHIHIIYVAVCIQRDLVRPSFVFFCPYKDSDAFNTYHRVALGHLILNPDKCFLIPMEQHTLILNHMLDLSFSKLFANISIVSYMHAKSSNPKIEFNCDSESDDEDNLDTEESICE